METKWLLVLALVPLIAFSLVSAEGEVWEEDEHELLIRNERGAKNRETCRYVKGPWTDCDSKTHVRSRSLTLKKGDPATCERTKTIQKKCKKACRYEKATWSECSAGGEMSRTDMLKENSDPACEQSRHITKKCNKNKQGKTNKDKERHMAHERRPSEKRRPPSAETQTAVESANALPPAATVATHHVHRSGSSASGRRNRQ